MSDIINLNDAYHWNITRLAEGLGFSRPTVRARLRDAGIKPVGKKNGHPVYSLEVAAKALFAVEVKQAQAQTLQDPDKMQARERKDWYQSENERLKFMSEVGQLIPEDKFRQELYDAFSLVVAFFENLPDKMERTGLFDAVQLELMEKENDNLRQQLYLKLMDNEPNANA